VEGAAGNDALPAHRLSDRLARPCARSFLTTFPPQFARPRRSACES